MKTELYATIKKEFEIFDKELRINPSYARKQREVIDLVDLYWMNKYKESNNTTSGYRKIFDNIILNPIEVAAKMIDFDTKDIKIIAESGQSYYPAWFFETELRIWMKNKKNKDQKTFGQFLNELVFNFPKYGHLLVKKAKNSVSLVPLQNVICNPIAKNFTLSDFLMEKHEYSYYELRQQKLDNIEKVISKYGKDGNICVYERHGALESSDYNYFIFPEGILDDRDFMLYEKIDRDELYRELKWDDIPARALGRGQAERLFEAQIATNMDENLFRDGLRWTSKHIFQTRDDTITRNLVNQIDNGEILKVLSEVTPVSVEERNLSAYNWAYQKWSNRISEISFSAQQALSGERPPAGTPLGTTIANIQQASGFYDFKREDLGLFLKGLLFDWIIPSFKKEKKSEELMMGEFDQDKIEELRGLMINKETNRDILDYFKRNKNLPEAKEAETIKALSKEKLKKNKSWKIPEDYYDNLEYKIDIILTNEQIDTASRLSTLQTIMQILGSNPTILQDKRTRKIFYKAIDLAGFSPVILGMEDDANLEEVMATPQRGGSIAAPVISSLPAKTNIPSRL